MNAILAAGNVTINGQTYAVVASAATLAPKYRTPENAFVAFVCGGVLGDRKTFHATPEAAIAAAEQLVERLNGAFFPVAPIYVSTRACSLPSHGF